MRTDDLTASAEKSAVGRAKPLNQKFCEMPFTGIDIRDVLRYLEMRTVNDRFTYIVTPNVDHVVRNWRDKGSLTGIYEDAELSLCDSRIVSLIGRFSGVSLPVVTGSDLTSIVLRYTVDPQERITVIGGSDDVVAKLARRFGLQDVCHFDPPMGFIRDQAAVLEAAQFVEQHPSRFVLLAVGSPQQELLARAIKQRGQAVGIGLCIGASLLFLTGDLQRAPVWMQRYRLEWLHRLAQEPKRMWRRYLYDAPKILRIAAEHKREQRVLVSVIVPTLQHEELLPRLIERCGAQAGFNAGAIELILVDRSPQGSARSIVERSANGARAIVRCLYAPDAGPARARILGIAAAKGDFLAFVHDAALPSAGWLESMLKVHRIYDADAVLGPVDVLTSGAGSAHEAIYRTAFGYTNDASTGTTFEARRPIQFTGGGCFVPFDLRNAMMLKANYEGELGKTASGQTDDDDVWFLHDMQHRGRRLVWCAEAVVQEEVPAVSWKPSRLFQTEFRRNRLLASTAIGPPIAVADLVGWLTIGVLQALSGAINFLLWPIARSRGLRGIRTLGAGIGKLSLLTAPARYATMTEVIVSSPVAKAEPGSEELRRETIIEPYGGGAAMPGKRWWRRGQTARAA